jgi:hypothetical protein
MPPKRTNKRQRADDVPEAEPKRSDLYYYENGDLEIVSANGILYKLPAYYLQASS